MKRAFVTGATGFTGSYLCRALLAKGYTVKALARKSSNKDSEFLKGLDIEWIDGDLANLDDIDGLTAQLKDIDIVFHIAALYRQEGVSREMFTKVNVDATRILLDQSIAAGVKRFVHCSTVGVQGEIENPPADEDAPYNPGDHYQDSKLEGEKLALYYFKEGKIDGAVVRPVGIYGPGDTRFLKLFRHIYKGNFKMIGSGKVLYHLTFVEDLVEGIILAGEVAASSGKIYTIGGNEYLPLDELVKLLSRVLDKKVSTLRIPLWPVYIAAVMCELICKPFGIEPPLYRRRLDFFTKDRAFDISRARKDLGYEPKVPLKEGLTRTAEWYKKKRLLD